MVIGFLKRQRPVSRHLDKGVMQSQFYFLIYTAFFIITESNIVDCSI